MFLFGGGSLSVFSGHVIERSLRFRSTASASLSRTFGAPSANGRKTWSMWFWYKPHKFGTQRDFFVYSTSQALYHSADDKLGINQSGVWSGVTAAVFRDPTAWYLIHMVYDTTQAVAADRVRIWVNRVAQTISTTGGTLPAQNSDGPWNQATSHTFGAPGSAYIDCGIADLHFVDGLAVLPDDVSETDINGGVNPITYAGSFGNNGAHIDFADPTSTTTIGYDVSGNANHWTANNISVTAGVTYDSLTDTPTNGNPSLDTGAGGELPGNYATMNPLDWGSRASASGYFVDGNLTVADTGGVSGDGFFRATFGVSSAKFKWSVKPTVLYLGGTAGAEIGIARGADYFSGTIATTFWVGTKTTYGYCPNGNKYTDGAGPTAYGATYTTNDIIDCELDMDAGTLTFFKNGVSQGVAFTGLTGTWFPFHRNNGGSETYIYNFGQRAFDHASSTGFKCLCTANLPNSAIADPSLHFDTLLYAGDGATTNRAITGLNFQSDFSWFKSRSAAANHVLIDSVRSTFGSLFSNSTAAEIDEDEFVSFDSGGFTIKKNASYDRINSAGGSMVAWNWKAGGAPASNTDGSITSSVSANQTAGFSVVGWSGTNLNATIGHGLSVAPELIIFKSRLSANGAVTYHKNLTSAGYYLALNTTAAEAADSGAFNSTVPAASVFSIGGNNNTNWTGTNSMIAWCFHSVPGFSKIDKYTGNGSADGPFVWCGFRPRYILIKRVDAISTWYVFDTARDTYNAAQYQLYPNDSAVEGSGTARLDVLSNGFKLRNISADHNASSGTYIYAAFAEHPFKTARAR